MQEDDDAFSSIWLTLLKSVTMTIGELDFNDNFIEREVVFPFLYAFWILFVIVMPVLFNNLLVSVHSHCKVAGPIIFNIHNCLTIQ